MTTTREAALEAALRHIYDYIDEPCDSTISSLKADLRFIHSRAKRALSTPATEPQGYHGVSVRADTVTRPVPPAAEEPEPYVWTWQSCENIQGWNTKYGDTPPEPGPWISDIQPLFAARPAPHLVSAPSGKVDRISALVMGKPGEPDEYRGGVIVRAETVTRPTPQPAADTRVTDAPSGKIADAARVLLDWWNQDTPDSIALEARKVIGVMNALRENEGDGFEQFDAALRALAGKGE